MVQNKNNHLSFHSIAIDQELESGLTPSSAGEESACNAGDPNSIPSLGTPTGEEIVYPFQDSWASLVAPLVENPPSMGRPGSIPGLGRSPGEGNGNPLQYSGLENSMDREAW